MSIEVSNISKRSARSWRSTTSACDIDGELVALLGPRFRQDDAAAHHRGARISRLRRWSVPRRRASTDLQRARPARRLRVPALRAVPPHDGFRKRGVRTARAPAPTAAARS